ncbi:MAG: hypothetical protein M3Q07_06430 [Pseudobdellovibrionaceae bacterium]|nr:hypothetical protein [Pseudobdellovibrionaceae bacterium]
MRLKELKIIFQHTWLSGLFHKAFVGEPGFKVHLDVMVERQNVYVVMLEVEACELARKSGVGKCFDSFGGLLDGLGCFWSWDCMGDHSEWT